MAELPISATTPYPFHPLAEALAQARERLAEAEQDLADARAGDAGDLKTEVRRAERALKDARKAVGQAERDLKTLKGVPVCRIAVPTYRTKAAFDHACIHLPQLPGDRPMFRAIQAAAAAGLIPADDPTLAEIAAGLKECGGSVPDDLSDPFNELYERVANHPAVRAIQEARTAIVAAHRSLKVRHFLLSVEGIDLPPRVAGVLPEAALDMLPPPLVDAIAAKIDELSTLRGWLVGKSAAPSSSPSGLTTSMAA